MNGEKKIIMKRRIFIALSCFMCIILLIVFIQLTIDNKKQVEQKSNVADSKQIERNFCSLALEDYDFMWNELMINYPFWFDIKKDIQITKIRKDYQDMVESNVNNIDDFYSILKIMFSTIRKSTQTGNSAHLDVLTKDTYNTFLSIYNDSEISNQEWFTEDEINQLFQENTIKSYSEIEEDLENQILPEVETKYYKDSHAVYFHFKSFAYEIENRDATIITDYIHSLEEPVDNIIIDITGNTGGSTEYWKNNIVVPIGGEKTYYDYVFFQDTPVNQRAYFLAKEYSDREYIPAQSINDRDNGYQYNDFTICSRWKFGISEGKNTQNIIQNNPHIWLLVDEQVYSAADNFAIYCQKTGWATVIGNRTMGDGLGINPSIISLKNTGLIIRFSTCSVINKDGELNAIYGTIPDILCKPNETPLKRCLKLIDN